MDLLADSQLVDTDVLWEPEESAAPSAATSLYYPPPTARASDGASLYQPPTVASGVSSDEEAFSEGYHSYGDEDSLGSAGYLLEPGQRPPEEPEDDLMDEDDTSGST